MESDVNITPCKTDGRETWSAGGASILMQIKARQYQKYPAQMYLIKRSAF